MNKIKEEWGKFIGQKEWDYFITLTPLEKKTKNTNYRLLTRIYERNRDCLDDFFGIVERFKDDYFNTHIHMLTKSKGSIDFKKRIKNLHESYDILCLEVDKGKVAKNGESLRIGYYITKFITDDLEYFIG